MVRRGTDESDFVATLNIVGKVYKNGQMGVPAPDQNKVLSHESHAPALKFLCIPSSEEDKTKTQLSGFIRMMAS